MIVSKKFQKQSKIIREIIAEVGPQKSSFDSDDDEVTNARVVNEERVRLFI